MRKIDCLDQRCISFLGQGP